MKSSKALKEWASTCQSYLEGEPLLLLRKGGVGDAGLERPDGLFWLVPTWLHQQEQGLRPEALGLLERSAGLKSPPGSLHLSLAAQLYAGSDERVGAQDMVFALLNDVDKRSQRLGVLPDGGLL